MQTRILVRSNGSEKRIITSASIPQEETSIDEFFNVMATETLALFEHLEFDFLEEFDVFAPARRGEHEIITHQHSSERSCTATTRTSTASVQSRENSRTRSSGSARLRSTAVERRGRSLPHRPRTRRRRGLRPPRRAGRLPRPARLDLLHRFHRREDDARRPRRVERLRSNRRRVLPRLRLYDRLDRAKIPIAAEFTESKQALEETAMRVTCDALAVEKPIWMLGDSAYDTLAGTTTCWPQGRASRSVQRTKHRRSERHRVQGRSPHRRTQRGRSAEAIDARRDVQPPEWSRTNQRRRQGLRPGTFAPEGR